MSVQRTGGVDDATQTAPEEGEGNTKSSFVDELLNDAREMGSVIGDPVRTQPAASETEDEEETEQVTEEETPEEVAAEGDQGDVTDEEIEEEDQSKEEESEKKVRDEWPESAKARVAEETAKRKQRTKELEQRTAERNEAARIANEWKTRAEAAETQLSKASLPAPPTNDPLANIFDFQDLESKKRESEKYVAWAENNRSGGDFPFVKDEEGNHPYLDEKQVTNLKLGAEKILRDGIPKRETYLGEYQKYNQRAVEIYPDLGNQESPFYREANEIFQAIQRGIKPPDLWIWIGHAIKARNDYVASLNGAGKKDVTKKIVTSAKRSIAPTATKTRGLTPRGGQRADVDTARKNLQTKGDAESAEQLLERLNIGGGGRARRAELIEK